MKNSLDDSVWPVTDTSEFVHKIIFLEEVEVQDESGVRIDYLPASPPNWTWAKIRWMKGTDVIQAGQITSQLYGTVTMNFRRGLVAKIHIKAPPSDAVYVIQSVENVGNRSMFHRLNIVSLGANS